MPRCTIHCAVSSFGAGVFARAFLDFWEDFIRTGEGARPPISRSKTMCFPTRRTLAIRLDSRVATISDALDFSGSGLDPSHTDSMISPVTRLARPRAMVSTSGSSGMESVYKASRKLAEASNRKPALLSIARQGYHYKYTSAPLISFVTQRLVG